MLSKTYEAFVAAGAPEDKAREASEEIAGYDTRLSGIEADIGLIKARLDSIEERMATKTWVLSAMLAQTFAILGGVAALLRLLH
jgi:hypothetical protein